MYYLFVFFVIIFLLTLAKVILDVKEAFYIPEYLNHKTSCFDCEKEAISRYGEDGAWKATPTKLFAAEQQGVAMYGLEGGFIGKTMKYY